MDRSSAGSLNHRDGRLVSQLGACEVFIGLMMFFGISSRAVVMFLVEEIQRNIFDQRCVENELWSR